MEDIITLGNLITILIVILTSLLSVLIYTWKFSSKITTLEIKIDMLELQQKEVIIDYDELKESLNQLKITIAELNTNIKYILQNK